QPVGGPAVGGPAVGERWRREDRGWRDGQARTWWFGHVRNGAAAVGRPISPTWGRSGAVRTRAPAAASAASGRAAGSADRSAEGSSDDVHDLVHVGIGLAALGGGPDTSLDVILQ